MGFYYLLVLTSVILILLYILNYLTSTYNNYYQKIEMYECGFEPIKSNTRIRFSILYWIIAILYLIFDLELILILPFSTLLTDQITSMGYMIFLFFYSILTLALVYEYKKGALHF